MNQHPAALAQPIQDRPVNPYRPHRRKTLKQRTIKFPTSQNPSPPPQVEEPPQSTTSTLPLSKPPAQNPYAKAFSNRHHDITQQALHQCTTMSSSSSDTTRSADHEIDQMRVSDDISVRRTRHRLVYKPERLQYHTLGESERSPPPPLLQGLPHLSSSQRSAALSTLHEIVSLQAQLRACDDESQLLLRMLTTNTVAQSLSSMSNVSSNSCPDTPPLEAMHRPPSTIHLSAHPMSLSQPYSPQNENDDDSLSTITPTTNENTVQTTSISDFTVRSPMSTQNSTSTTTSASTVRSIQSSQNSKCCTIDLASSKIERSKYLDDFRCKHAGDFRIIVQNPRGIKEFRDHDPEYYPTMLAMKEGQCDLMGFVETNVPWHKNDFLYDISVVNKTIWSTPTKTIAASCRSENKGSFMYQPGGVMSIVANTLTTKIQSTSTDYLGRWTKIRFFAKGGAFVVYSVYRPNPATLASAGVNSSWMQQYRHLSMKNPKVNPRNQLILDLISDIQTETIMKSQILIMGDFNEDLSDSETEGIKLLMETTGLVQVFQEIKNVVPSTRGNGRAIDHVFITKESLQHVTQAGLVPEEICFASDHIALFVDLSPLILAINNPPIPPAPNRKLKAHNIPNVKKYVKAVIKQMQCHNIVTRLKRMDTYIAEFGFDEIAAGDLERIDNHMTKIMLKAEDDLGPSDAKYAFSEELLLQMRKVRLIKTFLRQHGKRYPLESYVDASMEDEAQELLFLSVPELENKLIEARNLLIAMQDESWEIRDNHNIQRVQAAAEKENKDLEIKIKEMKEREKQGRIFARIGNALTTKNFGHITRLGLPQEVATESTDVIWKYITSKTQTEMKKGCLDIH